MAGYDNPADNVFRFPEREGDGHTIEQVRHILLMSRESANRQLGVYGQEPELLSWAESNGFHVVGHVYEVRSGRLEIEDRPDMFAALHRLRQGEADAVAWATFARLARSVKQTRRIFHTCWEANVRTYVLYDDNEPFGEICPTHPEEFWVPPAQRAEDEGKLIQDRMTAGKRRKVLRGVWPVSGCAPPPFEMDRVEQRDQWTGEMRTVHKINRPRWVLKERMVAMHKEDGMGFTEIAKTLNAEGTFHRHGAEWTRESVRAVVRKPFPIRHDIVAGDLYERPDSALPRAQQSDHIAQRSA